MTTATSAAGNWFSYQTATVDWDGGGTALNANGDSNFAHTIAQQAGSGRTNSILRARSFSFGGLPSNASILGLQVDLYGYAGAANVYETVLQLVNGSAQTTADRIGSNYGRGSSGIWRTSNGLIASFGGSADQWGTALTRAILTSTSFGVDLAVSATGNMDCYVDYMLLTVTYVTSVTGTLGSADLTDTFTITSAVRLGGTLAAADQGDGGSLLGGVYCAGQHAVFDLVDIGACAGGIRLSGALSVSDLVDTSAAIASVRISGALSGGDAADLSIAHGSLEAPIIPGRSVTLIEKGLVLTTLSDKPSSPAIIIEKPGTVVEV